jgi:sirohydrochlorin cobaltochelatase
LILGHGSTVNPDSSEPTRAHAGRIRSMGLFAEVAAGFWKEEPGFRRALSALESPEVYIVPNFIGDGYFTGRVIPKVLALDGPITRREGRVIKCCEPVGNHGRMTDLLLSRAGEVAPGVPPGDTELIIVAHGTGLDSNSAAAARREAGRIAGRGSYRATHCAYLEEEPLIARWRELTSAPNVVVVPFFIADGLHSFQDIPVLLGIEPARGEAASRRDVFRNNPHALGGRNLYYASAIGTEPHFAEVILDQVAAFDARHAKELAPRIDPG